MTQEDFLKQIKLFLKTRFSLHKDKEEESEIVDSIRKGIEFRGSNVWILVFAIFLASIGLNMNSTAVIIGAMLISPLMGPIMGVGLGLGIFDFDLVKSAAKNLAVMVSVSLIASTIYFSLSPLSMAQSELLSRTTPTIWDVLIAFFGGLAGIVAGSSKEKGNVIPGVAIATALIPPLCAAGFGLARGDIYFFLGAFYLFCINAVFISVSTFLVVRLLKFSKHTLIDKNREKKIRSIISVIVVITLVPSIFIAYLTVRKALFEERANKFIQTEFHFDKTFVLNKRIDYSHDRIDVMLYGDKISRDSLDYRKARAALYNLSGTTISVGQGINDTTTIDINALKSGILEDVYSKNNVLLDDRDKIIMGLQDELSVYKKQELPVKDIAEEFKTLNKDAISISIAKSVFYDLQSLNSDTITVVNAKFNKKPSAAESKKLQDWLKVRTQADTLKLIVE